MIEFKRTECHGCKRCGHQHRGRHEGKFGITMSRDDVLSDAEDYAEELGYDLDGAIEQIRTRDCCDLGELGWTLIRQSLWLAGVKLT